MATDLENKVVVISGASSGLGRQLSADLARQRSHLVLGDKDLEGLVETQSQLKKSSASVVFQKADVTVEQDCSALCGLALKEFGRIDYLVLCAGVSMWARFDEVSDLTIFRDLVEVNYLGAVYCIHAALPALEKSGGMIVAISSLQGEIAIPRHTGYSASKHALNGFLEALEPELDGKVQILNIMPGWITGTNLRSNAFQSGSRSGGTGAKRGKASVSVQDCSRLIVDSMKRGAKTLFVPRKLRALLWLKALAPSLLKLLIGRAVDAQESD